MLSATTSNQQALNFLKTRLENRAFSISHKNFGLTYINPHEAPCVTAREIFIPTPQDFTDKSIKYSYAMQIHESAHILFSSIDFDRYNKVVIDKRLNPERARELSNIMEDYRVNMLISHTHSGAGRLMHEIHKDIVKDREYTKAKHALLPELCGYKTKTKLDSEQQRLLEQAVELIRPISASADMEATLKVLPEVYKLFYPKDDKDFDEDEGSEPGDTPTPSDDATSSPESMFNSDTKSKKEKQKNIEKAIKNMKEHSMPGGSEADMDSWEKDIETTCEAIEKIRQVEMKADTKDWKELDKTKTPELLKELNKDRTAPFTIQLEHHSIETGYIDGGKYAETIAKYKPEINKILNDMKKFIVFDRRWSNYKTEGVVNGKKLYKLIAEDDYRVFKKKSDKQMGNLAVLLLVDNSSSMYEDVYKYLPGGGYEKHTRIEYAKDTSIILHEVLSALKIKHMIVGYSADGSRHGDVDHIIFKTWNSVGKSIGLTTMRPLKNNHDGASIRASIKYFKNIHEPKKLMIVISDGVPECQAYSYSSLRGEVAVEDTVNAQREVTRKSIKLINIGLKYNMPPTYINKVSVEDITKLPYELLKILRKELR